MACRLGRRLPRSTRTGHVICGSLDQACNPSAWGEERRPRPRAGRTACTRRPGCGSGRWQRIRPGPTRSQYSQGEQSGEMLLGLGPVRPAAVCGAASASISPSLGATPRGASTGSMSIRTATRSGIRAATSAAVAPPRECPQTAIGPGGSCSMKATVSSANSDQWYRGSGLEESPWPRRSTAMPAARPASSLAIGRQTPRLKVVPCKKTIGGAPRLAAVLVTSAASSTPDGRRTGASCSLTTSGTLGSPRGEAGHVADPQYRSRITAAMVP